MTRNTFIAFTSRSRGSRMKFQKKSCALPLLLLPSILFSTTLLLFLDSCQSFSTPSPSSNNNNGHHNGGSSSNNKNPKYQTMSQQLRHEENLRRLSRINENIPGKTSAIPGSKDLPLNPTQTQNDWYNQASNVERKVKELTSKGMDYLRGLELEKSKNAFEDVYEIKPYTYCWQYGIVLFYLGEYHMAAEYFAKNARIYESKFGTIASEERIWRDACELKILNADAMMRKKMKSKKNQKKELDARTSTENIDSKGTSVMKVAQIENDVFGDPILGQRKETRKVIRIARDLFSSSIEHDLSNEAIARGKLRSICGEYEQITNRNNENSNRNMGIKNAIMKTDKKMWRLSSWFYLGLHYDVLDDVDASKECMKMALRQCGSSFGNGDDIIQTLPLLHMARRDWFDDDQFTEDEGDFASYDDEEMKQEEGYGYESEIAKSATPLSTSATENYVSDELFQSIRDSVEKMKLVELQKSLKKKGLKSSGSKSVLRDRLLRSLLDEVGFN